MNFFKLYIGDYQRDTAHLSVTEHGAYMLMLQHYYATEKPLPIGKALHRMLRAQDKAERDAIDAVVQQFWVETPDGLVNGRADEEITKAGAQADTNARIAREREARRKAEREAHEHSTNRATNGQPNQTPDTRHHSDASHPQVNTATSVEVAPALPSEDRPPLALVEPSKPGPKGPPDCPHQAVLALWAEVLPAMPQHLPSQWRGARADHLRARWRETAVEKGWATEADGLAYLRRLFAYVGQSAFLTGRTRPREGARPFCVELEWLVSPTNWAKVIEGKYHTEAA